MGGGSPLPEPEEGAFNLLDALFLNTEELAVAIDAANAAPPARTETEAEASVEDQVFEIERIADLRITGGGLLPHASKLGVKVA